MFFKRRKAAAAEPASTGASGPEPVEDDDGVDHGEYTIIPRAKQLYNGNWVVRVQLKEDRPEGARRYDYAGPMAEYPSEEEAKRAGIDHAIERLNAR